MGCATSHPIQSKVETTLPITSSPIVLVVDGKLPDIDTLNTAAVHDMTTTDAQDPISTPPAAGLGLGGLLRQAPSHSASHVGAPRISNSAHRNLKRIKRRH